jgi:hypothetical protein
VNIFSAGILEHNDFNNLSVFPNPTNGLINVSVNVTGDEKNMEVILTDLAGRVIYRRQLDAHQGNTTMQMNTSSFPKGAYFLELNNSHSRAVKKIIVE